ncbi:MAG: hypothetical protein FWG87_13705 [Defluviitaleaceae bacterium]|nr:hypothetical protein [Defluviitaleaceae bacterium]
MSDTTTQKRKTTTSWQVKQRYNRKVYTKINADLPKELVATFKLATKQQGVSIASVFRKAMEQFIQEYPPKGEEN